MADRLFPDPETMGAYYVRFGPTSQSYVDPYQPDLLLFEYVAHISLLLEHSAFRAPADQRLRVVHIGGAGMTIPRWVAHRRPETAQVVCEPDVELTEEVRRKIPLPSRSGIKVRDVDGRTGLAAMPSQWADVIIVDAFKELVVPGDLVTQQALDDLRRIGRGDAVVIFNITDKAPFEWARKLAGGLNQRWKHSMIGMENDVYKGRRFGNLLMLASDTKPDTGPIERESGRRLFGYRWVTGHAAQRWPGGALPFTDDTMEDSPGPRGRGW
ncbi:spermidine synthase [Tessaracoccus sp. ZS01]|uniref:spermidine synthase n=1 Tax=Tessaracoccus sp. ZS01 TaxID=1906324 RepID=UPI00117BF3E3|nr:fused MFS/spermidine synthase [Tessaracoccus sp. ZS01]